MLVLEMWLILWLVNVKLAYVFYFKSWSSVELCHRDATDLAILLESFYDDVTPQIRVELWVDGKTMVIDYEEDLVSLRICIIDSNCDQLLLSHDITLEYDSY